MIRSFVILLLIASAISGMTQSKFDSTSLIVRAEESSVRNFLDRSIDFGRQTSGIKTRVLSKSMNISLIYDIPYSYQEELKEWIESELSIEVYYDFYLEQRKIPNDPVSIDQWALEKIGAYDAWDETTGGSDYGGRKPVITILDDGFDLEHEDLEKNIFANPGEIPDNAIDDDNNGYVDDYRGLNIITGNDQHQRRVHGTSVCGIIGADSNNGIGMTGINWDAQLLMISGVEKESAVIESADYLYNLRKRYNDSNGAEGMYIVVNNYSGGASREWASDHPLWCETYDLLGSVGILSIGATANDNINVDMDGDMPSTCSSPYLIMVNSMDILDKRVQSAYSSTHLDIGAPGKGTLSLGLGGSYIGFEGTSAAAPHVAGAAALLFTVPCDVFYELTVADPAQAALVVKDALLSGVDHFQGVLGTTTSGGRLNIFNAMIQLTSLCAQEFSSLSLKEVKYSDTQLTVRYTSDKITSYTFNLYNSGGRKVYTQRFNTDLFGDKQIIVPIGRMVPGLYFLTIEDEKTKISKAVFIYR